MRNGSTSKTKETYKIAIFSIFIGYIDIVISFYHPKGQIFYLETHVDVDYGKRKVPLHWFVLNLGFYRYDLHPFIKLRTRKTTEK